MQMQILNLKVDDWEIFMNYGIILAGGSGKRFSKSEKKQFVKINNKKVLYYSLDKFLELKQINKVILVLNKEDYLTKNYKDIIKKYGRLIDNKKLAIIYGGNERYDSVHNALIFIKHLYNPSDSDCVLIHDAARPNVDISDIKNLIKCLKKYNAISLSYRLNDSIKEIKNNNLPLKNVVKSLDRDKYSLISTPQGFNYNLLFKCYQKFYKSKKKYKITDDLQLIELFSHSKTYLLDSSPLNLKITTKNDLQILKNIL